MTMDFWNISGILLIAMTMTLYISVSFDIVVRLKKSQVNKMTVRYSRILIPVTSNLICYVLIVIVVLSLSIYSVYSLITLATSGDHVEYLLYVIAILVSDLMYDLTSTQQLQIESDQIAINKVKYQKISVTVESTDKCIILNSVAMNSEIVKIRKSYFTEESLRMLVNNVIPGKYGPILPT